MAVILGLHFSRHAVKKGVHDIGEKLAVFQADVLEQFSKRRLRHRWRRLFRGGASRIGHDRFPVPRRFEGVRRVLGVHLLPRPERPAEVVRLEVVGRGPVNRVVLFPGLAHPNRRTEALAIIQKLADVI